MSSKRLSLQAGGSFSLCEGLPFTIRVSCLMYKSSVSHLKVAYIIHVFQLPVGSFLLCECLPGTFWKLPIYCACLQNNCLYRQGEVSHYVNVLPSPLWSFLLNVDGFHVSSGSCQHHVDVFQLPEGSFLTKRMSSRHLSYLLIVYVFDVVWKWPTSGRGPPSSSRMYSHYVNVSQALFEVTYSLWMSSISSVNF